MIWSGNWRNLRRNWIPETNIGNSFRKTEAGRGSHFKEIEELSEPHLSLRIEYAYRMCRRKEHLAMSTHIMDVGKKQGSDFLSFRILHFSRPGAATFCTDTLPLGKKRSGYYTGMFFTIPSKKELPSKKE